MTLAGYTATEAVTTASSGFGKIDSQLIEGFVDVLRIAHAEKVWVGGREAKKEAALLITRPKVEGNT